MEGKAKILGQPVERDVEVTRQGGLNPGLIPEIYLIALEEVKLVGFVDVQRRALGVGVEHVAVGLEQRGQDRGDGIRFPRRLHADTIQRGNPVQELRVERPRWLR